ncbi:MAG TPA: hypothetical protein PKI61_00120 [bacterium]|nr:hypothetical protein [bacterium]
MIIASLYVGFGFVVIFNPAIHFRLWMFVAFLASCMLSLIALGLGSSVIAPRKGMAIFIKQKGKWFELRREIFRRPRLKIYYLNLGILEKGTSSFDFPVLKSKIFRLDVQGKISFTLEQTGEFVLEEIRALFEKNGIESLSLNEIIKSAILEANPQWKIILLKKVNKEMDKDYATGLGFKDYPDLGCVHLNTSSPLSNIKVKKAWLEWAE